MLTIKQNNLRLMAAEAGRRANNYIDCDVVQDAISQLESYDDCSDPARVTASMSYLACAIAYRRHKSDFIRVINNLMIQFDKPDSLLHAVETGDDAAAARWVADAEAGKVMRIL